MELQGVFHSYTYPVQHDGYGVLRVRVAPGSYAVCEPRGCLALANLTPGAPVTMTGEFADGRIPDFPFYGEPRFHFKTICRSMPLDVISAVEFVKNLQIRGIADANAQHIVNLTGPDIESYFANNPDAVDFHKKIPSVTISAAEAFIRNIMSCSTEKKLFDFAYDCGFSYGDVMKLYKAVRADMLRECGFDEIIDILAPHKMNALGVIPHGVYYYGAKAGIAFDSIDHLGKKLGYRAYNVERIKSLTFSALQKFETGGHIWSSLEQIYESCRAGVMKSAFPQSVISRWAIFAAIRNGKGLFVEEGYGKRIYLESSWFDEHTIANGVRRIQASKKVLPFNNRIIDDIEQERGFSFSPAQKLCFDFLQESGIHIVTGGAGTGKTTVISGLLSGYTRNNPKGQVALCAPTGRAAQRMTELCHSYGANVKAFTIHKLLDFVPFDGDAKPSYDETNPLEADMIIVDEMSMVDMHLFAMLINAIKDGALVILCGDVSQLPSVGAGRVFCDLIESEQLDVVRLTSNYRQAGISGKNNIIANAERINAGKWVLTSGSDFSAVECKDDNEMRQVVLDLVTQNPDRTVLSTVREGCAGVNALNIALQPIINTAPGKSISIGRFIFGVNDIVLMTRNNYEIGYVNGDVGRITDIDAQSMTIELGDDEKTIPRECFSDVQLAYAMTIHKSQGSEYDDVVVVLPSSAPNMLARNLLYTAVTRAKKHVTIVGCSGAIRSAVHNIRNQNRRTTLCERLRA